MSEKIKQYRYSEIFGGHGYYDSEGKFFPGTFQGEGFYTGIPSVWFRTWGCNFECGGFGQDDPSNPESYKLPYKDLDLTNIQSMEELPIIDFGCDSAFSWSKKFMHLAGKDTAEGIVKQIRKRLYKGKFNHDITNQPCHMVFTGGEPILSQHALIAIMKEFVNQDEIPQFVTIETNGSLPLSQDFIDFYKYLSSLNYVDSNGYTHYKFTELFWSVSPKILATSGEEKGIQPEIVKQYWELTDGELSNGQLKFVCNGSERSWLEIDNAVSLYRKHGIHWPVWIMPVGATLEGQEKVAADVSDQALYRGYNVSSRVHVSVYGNGMGR